MFFESTWYNGLQETGVPKYVRLYFCIRREIETGNIASGLRLPSIRQVSNELGLSKTTVENAYNQLLVEGYIHSMPQKGYYAAHLDKSFLNVDQTVPGKKKAADTGKVNGNYTDTGIFDLQVWKKTYMRVIEDFQERLYQEGDPRGEQELRKALSEYVYRARGVQCDPDQIVIGAGVQTLIHFFCDITAGMFVPKIALEEPGFADVRPVFQKRGYSLQPVNLDSRGIRVESLFETGAALCYTSPSHQYPTGLVMPIQKRLELIKWADQVKGYILEDDYDSELRFSGRPVPSLFSLDSRGRVVYIGSFSTVLIPSIRVSYMIMPKTLEENFRKIVHEYRATVSTAEQLTLALFLKGGLFEKHLRHMRKKCSERLKTLTAAAIPHHTFFGIHPSDTGTFVLLEAFSDEICEVIRKNASRTGLKLREVWSRFFVLQYSAIPGEKYPQLFLNLIQMD